ncbi:MAG: O-fucosyltransferase family protein [Syntrophomonadaceae bacterium]|nr:O-fucosyltransferase family protein [Syntrophomonadaceae bacterium]
MCENKIIDGNPKDERFLLIKHIGGGFWSDIHDVQSKILLAEITNRHPVVYWGWENCYYTLGEDYNSFEQYYLPVSDYSIGDVVNDKYTYYPPTYKFFNVFREDRTKWTGIYRDVPSFINCDTNVLVSDLNCCVNSLLMHQILPWVKEDHPAYGLTEDEVFRYINNKYMKLRPDIVDEIEEFYHNHMETGPILAVHVRAGAKLNEDSHWSEVNAEYPHEIDCYLKDNPSARIFLLTDDEIVLEQYKQMYGDILIYTDCSRKTINDYELCVKAFPDNRRKGIEIIKDTYLACKCDYFIGNVRSNVSMAVKRLKDWEKDKIKMFI